MAKPTIINGVQTENGHQYRYTGLELGRYQYRIYEDRDGWFVEGDYTSVMPGSHQAKSIWRAIQTATPGSFLEYLKGGLEKWQLKEKAGI